MSSHKTSPEDLVKAVRAISDWFDQQAAKAAEDADCWGHVIRARALDEVADVLEKQKNILTHMFAEKLGVYFICGESGDKDTTGLPERIFVCPSYGMQGMAVYTKTQDYKQPEW